MAPGKSWTRPEENDDDEDADDVAGPSGNTSGEDSEEELRPRGLNKPKKGKSARIESESEEDEAEEDEDEDDDDDEDEEEEEELVVIKDFRVGQFVVAVYDGTWYIGQVEGEEPGDEVAGFTLIRYMERLGDRSHQFKWPNRKAVLWISLFSIKVLNLNF